MGVRMLIILQFPCTGCDEYRVIIEVEMNS